MIHIYVLINMYENMNMEEHTLTQHNVAFYLALCIWKRISGWINIQTRVLFAQVDQI